MTKLEIEVLSATIIEREYGTDIVHLKTTLPSPFPPGVDDSFLTLEFRVQKGAAAEYLKKELGLQVTHGRVG